MSDPHRSDFRRPRPQLTLWVEEALDRGRISDWPFLLHLPGFLIAIGSVALPAIWSSSPIAVVGETFGVVIAAALFYRGHRQRRQQMIWMIAGHCRRCGYDLRQSPVRCPECGTPRR